MAKRGLQPVPPRRVQIAGHVVEVRGEPDEDEQLWIDGERRHFFTSSGGYRLLDDAYRPSEKTLLEAGRRYVERLIARAD